jgi:hypothetical protein
MTSENVPSSLSEPEVNSSFVARDEIAWIVQKVKEAVFHYHGL